MALFVLDALLKSFKLVTNLFLLVHTWKCNSKSVLLQPNDKYQKTCCQDCLCWGLWVPTCSVQCHCVYYATAQAKHSLEHCKCGWHMTFNMNSPHLINIMYFLWHTKILVAYSENLENWLWFLFGHSCVPFWRSNKSTALTLLNPNIWNV